MRKRGAWSKSIAGTPVRICLDTGHLLLGGSDPIALLRDIGDRVVHVHAKDVDGAMLARMRSGEIDYFAATGQGLYSDLGTGIVDWLGLRDGLAAFGFSGMGRRRARPPARARFPGSVRYVSNGTTIFSQVSSRST